MGVKIDHGKFRSGPDLAMVTTERLEGGLQFALVGGEMVGELDEPGLDRL